MMNHKHSFPKKHAKMGNWLMYPLGGLFLFSFILVYVVPHILQAYHLDEYFLQISQGYNLGFAYKHDALVNAVAKMYFIFVYPYIAGLIILVALFSQYKIYHRVPDLVIHKNKEALKGLFGSIVGCLLIVLSIYLDEPFEPKLLIYRSFLSSKVGFSFFLWNMQTIICCFPILFFLISIDTLLYLCKGDKDEQVEK